MKVSLTLRAFLILSLLWLVNLPSLAFFQNSAAKVKTKYEFTDTRISRADTLLKKRKYQEALDAYENAYDTYEAESFYEGMVYAKERMGRTYRSLSQDSLSKSTFREAASLSRAKLGPNHILESKAYLNNGIRAHFKNTFIDASRTIDSSMWAYEASEFYDSAMLKSLIDFKFYTYYYSGLSKDTVIRYLNKRVELYQVSVPEKDDEIYLLSDYSRAFYNHGDYHKSEAYALEASRLSREFENEITPFYYSDALFNLGKSLQRQEEYSNALEIANELIRFTLSKDPMSSELRGYYNLKAVILNGQERFSEASAEFKKVMQLLEQRNSTGRPLYRVTEMNLGVCYARMGRFDEAGIHLFKALKDEKEANPFPNNQLTPRYEYLGLFYESQGDFQNAILYFDSAARSSIMGYSESLLDFPKKESLTNPTYESLNILTSKALNMGKLYEYQFTDSTELLLSVLEYAKRIHNETITNREELEASEGKLFLSENFKKLYEGALSAAFTLHESTQGQKVSEKYLDEAFTLMANSKSLLFLEQSGELGKVQDDRLPLSMKTQYFLLKTETEELEQKFDELSNIDLTSDTIRQINSRLLELNSKLKELKVEIISLLGEEAGFVGPDYIQVLSILEKNSDLGVIEYFYGDKYLFVLAISHDGKSFQKINLEEDFGVVFREFLSQVSEKPNIRKIDNSLEDYKFQGFYLYQILLEKALISFGEGVNKLTIIPDENLSKLPFEALITSIGEELSSFDRLDYVIRLYDINYSLSSSQVHVTGTKKKAEKGLFGIGYSGKESSEVRSGFGSLPGTEEEIQYLKANIPGDYFLGLEGSKKKFLSQAKEYDVLHLAIHGEADRSDRYKSSLIFNGDDNVLRTNDLYRANLKARLAILSACESGIGEVNKGEGTFSIARGFALVGVPSVVMSLWKVNDKIASELMVDLHKRLQTGTPVNSALSEAKRNYINKSDKYTAHPYYWSAFVSLGEQVDISDSRNWDSRLIWTLIVILLFTLYFLFLKKRKEVN